MTDDQVVMVLLFVSHFVGDFVLQTHNMAVHKNSDLRVLIDHVMMYFVSISVCSMAIFLAFDKPFEQLIWFTMLTSVLHFCTDLVMSKITHHKDRRYFLWFGLDQMIHQLSLFLDVNRGLVKCLRMILMLMTLLKL